MKNNTKISIFNVTAMLIGIDCPSLDFGHKKIEKIEGGNSESWKFTLNINNPEQKQVKLKYAVRFFFDQTMTSEDYRNSKEGFYDFELQQPQNSGLK